MDKDSMRVHITMPAELVAEVDKLAKKFNLSRSSYITMVVSQYAEQRQAMDTLQELYARLDDSKK